MGGVHFGTQSDREALPEYLHHFFGSVDRGLKATLAGKPLLLMGVHEEIAAYRRVAKYAHILTPDYSGNTDFWTTSDIAARAAEACRAYSQELAAKVLAEYQEMAYRGRTLGDVQAIVRAASEGRVHRLCVRNATEVHGPGGEDLLNAGVAETLRAGGEVFTVPQEKMPAANPMVAILRY
jgi:sporulation protein YlmC with PRC-barrel domain